MVADCRLCNVTPSLSLPLSVKLMLSIIVFKPHLELFKLCTYITMATNVTIAINVMSTFLSLLKVRKLHLIFPKRDISLNTET